MAGIYIHVPFCRQACHYCNFHFSTQGKWMPRMVEALHRELQLQADYLGGVGIETVYFGGGTPSLLSGSDVHGLMDALRKQFSIAETAEVTLEANPDDIYPELLDQWLQAGINRLSIGIQSFSDSELSLMNRSHKAVQALKALESTLEAGFNNLTADLIYGLPESTADGFGQNIDTLLQFPVRHISVYGLTIEPRTALAHFVQTGKVVLPDEALVLEQYAILTAKLETAGFRQYEISNFALPGHEAIHNTNYWMGVPYLGIGPSAHSFTGQSRQWNISHNSRYMAAIADSVVPAEVEALTPQMRFNELLLTRLRTIWGVPLDLVQAEFGEDSSAHLRKSARPHLESGHLQLDGNTLRLAPAGRLLADRIAADLFI